MRTGKTLVKEDEIVFSPKCLFCDHKVSYMYFCQYLTNNDFDNSLHF